MAGTDLPKLRMQQFPCGDRKVTLGILRGREEDGLPTGRMLPLVDGHRFVSEINSEHGTSLKIIHPRLADRIITSPGAWSFFGTCSPFLTDSILAYGESHGPLGHEIEFHSSGFRFVVPTWRYCGEEAAALLVWGVTFADFNIQKNDVFVAVPMTRILPIRDFPTENGTVFRHPMLTAPILPEPGGRASVLNTDLPRRMWRQYQSSYVGPVVRSTSPNEDWHHIHADRPPTSGFGVVVEVPEKDLGKFK